jgi:hypothetical protein
MVHGDRVDLGEPPVGRSSFSMQANTQKRPWALESLAGAERAI